MKRDILQQLIKWKNSAHRKPLLLYGARQVGKTYTLLEFAKTYPDYIYLNFEDQPILKDYFERTLDPEEILQNLVIHYNKKINKMTTLIIFDEIQECPKALNSLKYFNEQAHEYHVCAAGSLLGVKIGNKEGFPVGQVNFLHLYPLSFLEFLEACNEINLREYLENINTIKPLPEPFHNKLIQFLRVYYFTGGMPEAVQIYLNTKDFAEVRKVHKDILKSYDFDFAKHAPKTLSTKISQVWHSLPSQLARENKKFIYSLIRESARARDYEEAIQWLQASGLIIKVVNVSVPKFPLKAYANFEIFKLYALDVGLLNTIAELPFKIILEGNALFQEFQGALTENYVTQSLALHFENQFYWTSHGSAEIDALIQFDSHIVPLEIKSGTSTKSKSLKTYFNTYKPAISVRTSLLNLKDENHIINIPLYLIQQINRLLDLS